MPLKIYTVDTPSGPVDVSADVNASDAEIIAEAKKKVSSESRGAPPTPQGGLLSQPQDFSAANMMRNIPSSASNLAGDMVYPFRHPVETAKGLGNAAMGGIQKLIPGKQDKEVYADQIAQMVKDRYGSMDAFKKTMENDPIGALADVSLLITGAGGALRGGAKIAGTSGKVASGVTKAGMAVDPINAAINTAKAGVNLATKNDLPQRLYQSAAKFSTTMPHSERAKIVQTALDNKIMPTPKGYQKLQDRITDLNANLDKAIMSAEASGQKIHKNIIYRHLGEAKKKLGGPRIEAAKDLEKLDKIVKSYDDYLEATGKTYLTPKELQEFKVDAYNKIKWTPGKKPVSDVKTATYKQMARGAKEGIEHLAPDVAPINKELGSLYDLSDPLSRSAARIDNRNLLSINTPLNMGGGYAAAAEPGAIAGGALSVLGAPKVKAANAMLLNKIKQQGLLGNFMENSQIPFWVRQGLLQGGRISGD